MSEKYVLGPAARALKAQIDGETYEFEPYSPTHDNATDPDGVMEEIRPRLYEVSAVIGAELVNAMHDWAFDTYPDYGLIGGHGIKQSEPKSEKRTYRNILSNYLDTSDYFMSGRAGYKLPRRYNDSYDELEHLVKIAKATDPEAKTFNSARVFIQGGINTGSVFSIAAHIGINSLYRATTDDVSGDRFRSLAANSYRLVTPIALDNVGRLYSYKRAIGAKLDVSPRDKGTEGDNFAYNPNLLKFVPDLDDSGAYVDFKECPAEYIDPKWACKVGRLSVNHPTLTCPGTIKFPNLEVASRLEWDWVSDVVTDVKYNS
jgi:hypothetical protein